MNYVSLKDYVSLKGSTLMNKLQDKDTRYFIEIDSKSLKVIRNSYDQKQNLDKGQQSSSDFHRLFLTKGQYNQFVERYKSKLIIC